MTETREAEPSASRGGGAPEPVLKSSQFRKRREAGWRELAILVGRVERHGVTSLSVDELLRLPLLYRGALSSLSVARSIALDRNLILYLENLALRAFLAAYGPRTGLWSACRDFLRRGFPAAVRTVRWHLLVAALALLVGGIAGFWLTALDESWFTALVPAGLAGGRGPASSRAELLGKEIFAPFPGAAAAFGVMANFLFSHNTVIGILAFSLGIAGGVPTLLLLAYQGVVLGAFLALHVHRGLTLDFLGWVSIHGVTELAAILLCGAAGLVVAETVLFPGRQPRVESLARHGRSAAQIAVGAVLMLFIAAILEGGCRQLVQSTAWRFAIGGGTGLFWLCYLVFSGKRR